ncbi:hypothetical protein [Acinetobacter sp.]|uniref:hypothetical protein n=1 Tax=Acinetobacter sp. TaxID=472 RepID=UPI0031D9D2CA
MITLIDGFEFATPLNPEDVKALAKFHRKQLGDAIYHEDQHIGNIGIEHRIKIAQFTRGLDADQRAEFYRIYNKELHRLAIDDPIHPLHAEHGVNIFLLVVTLVIIAIILYFAFVRDITS